jgi:coatomer protein complex subunit epsilon
MDRKFSVAADPLFSVRNNFYLGAFNTVLNDAPDLDVSDVEAIERDTFIYRSYIALGSYEVRTTA